MPATSGADRAKVDGVAAPSEETTDPAIDARKAAGDLAMDALAKVVAAWNSGDVPTIQDGIADTAPAAVEEPDTALTRAAARVRSASVAVRRSMASAYTDRRSRLREIKAARSQRPPKQRAPKRRAVKALARGHETEARRVDHVDLGPVAKVAAAYYLCVFGVGLVAAVAFWLAVEAAGIVGNIEDFVQSVGFDGFRFVPTQLLLGFAILGLAWVGMMVLFTTLAAAFYNQLAGLFGGVVIRTSAVASAGAPPDDRSAAPMVPAMAVTNGHARADGNGKKRNGSTNGSSAANGNRKVHANGNGNGRSTVTDSVPPLGYD